MQPLIRFATAPDDVRIAYSVAGAGTPIVFVRGWFSHLEHQWTQPDSSAYYQALAKRGRLVTFDCRGNGLSDRNPADVSLESLTSDLTAVMDALGLSTVVLYGMGYGGPMAIRLAAEHPERVSALVLFGTRARPDGADWSAFIRAVEEVPAATVLPAMHSSPDDPAAALRGAEAVREAADRKMMGRLFRVAERYDVRDECYRIEAPTLVMHPRRSRVPFALGREMAADIPDSRFVAIEGSDFNPWRAEPDRTIALIEEFLAEVGLPVAAAAPGVPRDDRYAFRREGEYWTVVYAGSAIRLRDARGLRYLATLLANPGRELHVAQLVDTDAPADIGNAGEVIDAETKRNYERRIDELREEIDDARRWDDAVRESRASEELDAIARELGAAFGLGGRSRKAADSAERMRKAITNRVKDSLTKIRREHPTLGAHLDASVRTGTFCAYEPHEPITWSL